MNRMKIAFFGECMIELSGYPLIKTFGGDTLNTALYLARLLTHYPINICFATSIGDDTLSDDLLAEWLSEGIHSELVTRTPKKKPGLYLVDTDDKGERSFHYWRSDSAAKYYFEHPSSPLEEAIESQHIDALYVSGISLAILSDTAKTRLLSCIKKLKAQNKTVFFDNNFRPQLWHSEHPTSIDNVANGQVKDWYRQILSHTDVALITEDDDIQVWGDDNIVERCKTYGCQQVVIKRGNAPSVVISDLQSHPSIVEVPAQKVENVVDTCAAGDAFAAGFLAGYLTQQPPTECAKLGHALAGTVIQFSGAIIPPTHTDKFHLKGS